MAQDNAGYIEQVNCDGSGPHHPGEVRLLPTGGGGNAILCIRCYCREIEFRIENGPTFRGALPSWDALKVYTGE